MNESCFNTPVLFLIFNRPDVTQRVFEVIRKTAPKQLFIAADGARKDKPGEAELCLAARKIVGNVDWDCELKILFRDENMGCGKAVSTAITWFFKHVEQGIILEDDCLPDRSFFQFAEELLDRYKDNKEIMTISGSNLIGSWKPEKQSYFFGQGGIWGWATWRRAWELYDISMKGWTNHETKKRIRKGLKTDDWYLFYYHMFESSFNGILDTWDAQWLFTILKYEGKSINPSVNLVKNIGFDNRATHTIDSNDIIENLPLSSIYFPLKYPKYENTDTKYLNTLYEVLHKNHVEKPFVQKIVGKIKRRLM